MATGNDRPMAMQPRAKGVRRGEGAQTPAIFFCLMGALTQV